MKFIAKTHDDRCMVLASIPRQAMIETIKDHVLKENGHYGLPDIEEQHHIQWLQSLVDGRFLCASDDLTWKAGAAKGEGMHHTENEFVLAIRKERLDAFLAFLSNPMFGQMENDPVHGALKRQPIVATMTVSDPFEAVFRQAVLQLIEDDNDTLHKVAAPAQQEKMSSAKTMHGMTTKQWRARTEMLTKVLCAVCALGQADLVAPIVALSPDTMGVHMPLDMTAWNDHLRIKKPKSDFTVSPMFYAVQFSQVESMKALVAAGMNTSATVLLEHDKTDRQTYSHDAQSVWNHVVPACSPSAFESALEMGCRLKAPNLQLGKSLETCTDPKSKYHDLSFHLSAFMAKGHMDLGRTAPEMDAEQRQSAATHIQTAVRNGHPEVIDHFKGRIPWGMLAPALSPEAIEDWEEGDRVPGDCDLVFKIAVDQIVTPRQDVVDALTHLLNHAIDDKHKGIFTLFSEHNGHNMEPVQALIDANLQAPMLAYMKAGLDVNASMRTDGRTPLQHAVVQGKQEIVHMMRSYTARQSVHGLLDEIENDSKTERMGLAP